VKLRRPLLPDCPALDWVSAAAAVAVAASEKLEKIARERRLAEVDSATTSPPTNNSVPAPLPLDAADKQTHPFGRCILRGGNQHQRA